MPDSGPTVLVLTDIVDPTADRVISELEQRSVPVFRANPGDFPKLISLAARLDQTGLDGTIRIHDRHGVPTAEVSFGDVGCVYYRRPTAFRIPDGVPEQWHWWAAREARQGFGGVISALPQWINHPRRHRPRRVQARAAPLRRRVSANDSPHTCHERPPAGKGVRRRSGSDCAQTALRGHRPWRPFHPPGASH
ncbi:MAG: MvdC/MvdD family ATP grasp protein [Micromonosporaceae bacterium]